MTDTITPEREAELLPCPFCGNDGSGPVEDSLHVIFNELEDRVNSWSVQCDKCTATMGDSDSEEAAIDAWNTRQQHDRIVALEAERRTHAMDLLYALGETQVALEEVARLTADRNDAEERKRITSAPINDLLAEARTLADHDLRKQAAWERAADYPMEREYTFPMRVADVLQSFLIRNTLTREDRTND